ncbi:MAG: hypothetical protein SVU32_08005 [Candidatus Nanohaloarchaea archaeon]|nr:hypothetical protein [Candidatus Nanohaloarchaea archaeon]
MDLIAAVVETVVSWKQVLALLAGVILFVGVGSGIQSKVDPQPGWISASHPLYPVDTAVDQASVAVGLTSPGQVAFERASEVWIAAVNNRSAAVDRAVVQLNGVAKAASGNDTQGLVKAKRVLEAVREETPVAADQGLSMALENVEAAMQRRGNRSVSAGNRSGSVPGGVLPF